MAADLGRREKTKPWSDLSEDLIVSIMERLYAADQIRFRAVCKNWSLQQSAHLAKPTDKLPWMMAYEWDLDPNLWSNSESFCKIYKPLHHNPKLPYTVANARIKGKRSFHKAWVRASLDSWLLLAKYGDPRGRLFFFNPFTAKVIYLPTLDYYWFQFVGFSSGPDSPTCLVFIVGERFSGYYVRVYSHADKIWKTYSLISKLIISGNGNDPYLGTMIGVCCMEGTGTIHCCFSSLHLVTFNLYSQETHVVLTACDKRMYYSVLVGDSYATYLLSCDRDLLLVYISKSCRDTDELCVLKLDLERKEWVIVRNLGGRAIFLGTDDNTSFCVSAGGETEIIANRVYYFHGYENVLRFQTLDGNRSSSSSTSHQDGKRGIVDPKIYGRCRRGQNIIWIQPPKHV